MNLVQYNLQNGALAYNFLLTKELVCKKYYPFDQLCYDKKGSNLTFIWATNARPFIFYNLTKRKLMWMKFKRLFK